MLRGTELFAGGWGKKSKDFSDAEFAQRGGDSKPVEKYELQQQSDFMRKIREDKKKLKKRNDETFYEIAAMAGVLDEQSGAGETIKPLGAFEADDDEDDVDLRYYDENGEVRKNSLEMFDDLNGEDGDIDYDPDTSITRLDNSVDVSRWDL